MSQKCYYKEAFIINNIIYTFFFLLSNQAEAQSWRMRNNNTAMRIQKLLTFRFSYSTASQLYNHRYIIYGIIAWIPIRTEGYP